MKRRLAATALTLAVAASMLAALAAPALADHPGLSFTTGAPVPDTFNSGGDGAEWELVDSFLTGNLHSDLEFFTQTDEETGQVETFVSSGVLGTGPNGGGQTILQLTQDGEVNPSFVAGHPSATCTFNPVAVLGLQHDVEAAPKGDVILNTDVEDADRSDAQILLDATDQRGRCHDNGNLGGVSGAPRGGLEIIDITDVANPVEIGLVSHIGEAHTVNVDPRRPHIAYAVTSSGVGVDGDGTRSNESPGTGQFELDGWEMLDLSSCMNFPEGTSVEDKRAACHPDVYRFRYPTAEIALGHTNPGGINGCHELELYPEDLLTCGSGTAAILFDIAGVFDDNGTPDDLGDDAVNGEQLPCRLRPSTSGIATSTGALVTDCVVGGDDTAGPDAVEGEAEEVDLSIPGWLEIGAPALTGVERIGSAHHQGGGSNASDFPVTEDIAFDHEAELTDSRRFILATDERGGGASAPGASCGTGLDNAFGNGGVHAYAVDRLDTELPGSAEEAFDAYARTPDGEKAFYQAEPSFLTGPEPVVCTSHLMQQIPGQNRIFMAWYSQGTRVVDLHENTDGTFEFSEAGFFIPTNANQWVSQIFKMEENEDGTFTYWGVASDFFLGSAGRAALDVYKVTLPAPPEPLSRIDVRDPDGDGSPGGPGGPGDPTEVPTDPTDPPSPPDAPEIDRLDGGDRVDTAVGVSQEAFESAEVATLARADDYADALTGGPLSAELDAPLLLTEVDQLSDATATELDRLGVSEVVVYGGNEAVSDAVLDQLRDAGYTVRRVEGTNRFATAAAVAAELVDRTGADGADSALLAEGFNADPTRGFPDAVSAAPLAAASGRPILLAVQDSLPPETADALESLRTTETLVVGGPAAIGEQVVADLEQRGHGPSDQFRSGADRYETSALVYDAAIDEGADPGELFLARGDDFADALVAGPAVATRGSTLLLVDPADLSDSAATEQVITDRAAQIDRVVLLGGDMAISTQVEDQVEQILTDARADQGSQQESATMSTDTGLVLLGLTVLPAAGLLGRRRRR